MSGYIELTEDSLRFDVMHSNNQSRVQISFHISCRWHGSFPRAAARKQLTYNAWSVSKASQFTWLVRPIRACHYLCLLEWPLRSAAPAACQCMAPYEDMLASAANNVLRAMWCPLGPCSLNQHKDSLLVQQNPTWPNWPWLADHVPKRWAPCLESLCEDGRAGDIRLCKTGPEWATAISASAGYTAQWSGLLSRQPTDQWSVQMATSN